MAFKLVISNRVAVKVEGSHNDENGKKHPFNFSIICERMRVDELQALSQDEFFAEKNAVPDFLVGIAHDWKDVQDEDGSPLEFSDAGLRQLFQIPGVAGLVFAAYMAQCGVVAKN